MAQLFRPAANSWVRVALVGLFACPALVLLLALILARSDAASGRNQFVEQPVPFSHAHHAGELGIDCRYCHTSVETAASAGLPSTHICMTCHSRLWTEAAMLAPVRQSLAKGRPLAWNRVNRLPDYVYFDHHAHVDNGVPCAACHGDVRTMPLTRQTASLSMGWCLACHRAPRDHIVAPAKLLMSAPYAERTIADRAFASARLSQLAHRGRDLTDCSVCHR